MSLAEYLIFFVLVVSTGAGVPGPGDASMIAAGALAGEGRLNIAVVLVTCIVGWMLGSLVGYGIGLRRGRSFSSTRDGWKYVAGNCSPRAIKPSRIMTSLRQ